MTMLTTEKINELLQIDDSYKAPSQLMKILFDREKREELFKKFLGIECDMTFDWFHIYFQDEHADRKNHKQDFTPDEISELLSKLVQSDSSNYNSFDVTAGSGGLLIQKWQHDRVNTPFWQYKPSLFLYGCEELSDRAIPFLLFNLLIRGMNATVVHGDALTRAVKQVYFIQNTTDNMLDFSDLNVMPHSNWATEEFNVKTWSEEPIVHIETEKWWE
ncbi:MAG TPA: N-6 DNA methylase [Candidatus Paenibacillus intestinavium]|nr:N-6 DNA methylase [Candidatus Paenibacillus intestinavium]